MIDEYEAVFGGGAQRLVRGRILGEILGVPLEQFPRFRDAWCERHQNPDREPGVGPLVIAVYCNHGETDATSRELASRVFMMRSAPMYRDHTHDTMGYTLYRFNVPANLDPDTLAAMAAKAVEPVDSDLRWATALGYQERN